METSAGDGLGFIEIIFTGVVALSLGFWQLWSINREIAKDKDKAPAEDGLADGD